MPRLAKSDGEGQRVESQVIIVAAMAENGVIGRQGRLPWHLPEELRLFRQLTLHHTIVMGRQTFASIGRPLPERRNIVVSRTLAATAGVEICRSLPEALDLARGIGGAIFVIGGATLYRQALQVADGMILSRVPGDWEGDVLFPPFDQDVWGVDKEEVFPEFIRTWYRRREGVRAKRRD